MLRVAKDVVQIEFEACALDEVGLRACTKNG